MFPTNCEGEKAFTVKQKIKFGINLYLDTSRSELPTSDPTPQTPYSVLAMLCVFSVV